MADALGSALTATGTGGAKSEASPSSNTDSTMEESMFAGALAYLLLVEYADSGQG